MTRSVIHNTTLTYLGQAYALLVGIVIMPFYLDHLGAEVYGLIGFYTLMQAWLQLLDMGLSPALVRQIAWHRGQPQNGRQSGWLLRSFELLMLPLAGGAALAIGLASAWIASHWLNAQQLDLKTLSQCIGLMGLMVALRLFATLYKSALQGLEKHAWLNNANVVIATLRYFGGLALVAWVSQSALVFFVFQTGVAILETLVFAVEAYRRLPPPKPLSGFNSALVKPLLAFSGTLSLTAVLWIVLTQLDKLMLSEALPLAEYGYFSLVALIATGVTLLINPLVQTLLPRMTVLTAAGDVPRMQQLYLAGTRFACSFLYPLAGLIALYAHDLLLAWSGNSAAADWAAPILTWYAPAAALMAANAFQFHLQYALGHVRAHLWYSVASLVLTVPALWLGLHFGGALGVAIAWFGLRLVSLLVWPPVVHRIFAPGVQWPWMLDQLRIASLTALALLASRPLYAALADGGRFATFCALALCGFLTVLLVALSDRQLVSRAVVLFNRPKGIQP